MMDITPIIINSAVASVIGAIVASFINLIKDSTKSQLDGQKALQQGMRELLWVELQSIYRHASENNGLSVPERRHLERVYDTYHALGGNGTGTRLYDEAMEFPVQED